MVNKNPAPDIADKLATVVKSLHHHWRLYIAEGTILMVLGVAAMVIPFFATLAIESFLGWLFFIGGISGLVMTVVGRHAPGFWWSLFSAAVAIAVGTLLLGWQVRGVLSLTFILAAFLAIDGVLTILFALDHRRQLSQRWGWLLVNGVLDLGLAGFIVWALPNSAMWVLGIIVGIDMWFGGFSLIAMALAARSGNVTEGTVWAEPRPIKTFS